MKRIILGLLCCAIFVPASPANDTKREPMPEGVTRVAVCNIGLVFGKYHKALKFKHELEEMLVRPKKEAKKVIDEMEAWSKALQQKDLPPGAKEEYEDKIRVAKQNLEEIERKIKRMLGKKAEDNLVTLWKDVQRGIRVYATEKRIDIVLGYGDPMQKELLDLFPNVNRKMQAMDQGGTVPLFVTPRADISQAVADWLNRRYLESSNRPVQKKPVFTRPVNAPPVFLGLAASLHVAGAAFQDGKSALARKDSVRAIACFTKAIAANPRCARAYSYRGRAHEKKGNFDKAITDCTTAIELDPKETSAYIHRATAYRRGKLDDDKAIADCEKALKLEPRNAEAFFNLGSAHAGKRNHDKGLAYLAKALELDPGHVGAYSNRALLYADQGDFTRAFADMDHVIHIDPQGALNYALRGAIHLEQGNIDKALADLAHAIRLDPAEPDTYLVRSVIYSNRGDYRFGLADVDKAIALGTKKTIKAYQIRSNIHTERGDFDKAVADANKAIELGPKDALGYLLRANAHARKNVHVGIKRDIDKALDLDSELAFGYMLRGQWYLLKHRMKANPEMLDKAITDLETAVKLDPTEWQGRMWRGVAYGEKEDAKKAFADFDAAIRHRPNQPRIYENRADLHRRLGNDKAADDDEEKAREIRRKAI